MNPSFAAFVQNTYTQNDVREALTRAGITEGCAAIVHFSMFAIGHMIDDDGDVVETWLKLLREAVGPTGAVILPAFSYSYCKKKVYKPLETLSTVNLLANEAIVMHQGYRSLDPIFSYVILPGSAEVAAKVEAFRFSNVCFDMQGSIVELAERLSSRPIVMQVKGKDEIMLITLVHHAMQKAQIPLRYFKKFSGITEIKGEQFPTECHYHCRINIPNTVYDLDKVKAYENFTQRVSLGPNSSGEILFAPVGEFLDKMEQLYYGDPWRFLKGPRISDEEAEQAMLLDHAEDPDKIVRTYSTPVKL